MLPSSKLLQLGGKTVATFTENLVQNLIDLVFFLVRKISSKKMAQTELVQKTAKWRRSEPKD